MMSIFAMRWMQTAGTTAPSTDWWIERRSEELAMLGAILASKQPALRSAPARIKGTKRRNGRAQRQRIFARQRNRQRRTALLRLASTALRMARRSPASESFPRKA